MRNGHNNEMMDNNYNVQIAYATLLDGKQEPHLLIVNGTEYGWVELEDNDHMRFFDRNGNLTYTYTEDDHYIENYETDERIAITSEIEAVLKEWLADIVSDYDALDSDD